ncbi:HipA protein [Butyricicoccus faecihominis]|uniref:HipA protein n=1 Tax=Butyricicoccus faecihominis TaxID=1712515 RepID=UPI00247942BB|nr:HipA protein [Butyricicoccus faecihominis]MCQ5128046.1 HipA protein [Butyricicoccus faecihominis]
MKMRPHSEYVLLNKDAPMLHFLCTRNAFDEPEFLEGEWSVPYRPIGYSDLTAFLEQRKAPKHRKHIAELLERYGCDDLEGFLKITHALSLNDTFWVKEAGATLTWAEVSLYQNEFDRLISEAAFDGKISESDLLSTSPEFGTDGYYAKCWIREGKDIYLYKSGSALYELEPLSEFLASQLSAALCPNAVRYELGVYHDKLVSTCRLFTSEKQGLAKASAVFGGERTIPALLDYFTSIGSEDEFRRLCVLDALILNPDRHYGNFGVLFDTDTMQVQKMAPVFDNNRALFPELNEEELENPAWYLQKCRPRLGKDFIVTARGLLTPEIRQDLKNLIDFRFQPHDRIEIPRARIEALNSIVQTQLRAIMETTE